MNIKQFIISMSLAAPLSLAAQATFEVGGIVYTEDLSDPSKLAVIVVAKKSPMLMEGMSAYEGDIVIPSTVEHDLDTYQVTGIAQGAFMGSEVESLIINDGPTKIPSNCIICSKLEKLVLPSTMTSVSGLQAPALEEMTFGDNIQTIEGSCFIGGAMTEIVLPAGLKNLKGSFINIDDLAVVTFGPNVKKIENSFMGISALKSVSLPGSLRTLKDSFRGCKNLESVEIQEGLQKLNGSFIGCENLKDLTLPSSLAVIEESFRNCAISSLTLPEGVTTIKDSFNSDLTTLTLPSSLAVIEKSFNYCDITSLTLPEGVTTIKDSFNNIHDLTTLTLPNSLTELTGSLRCYYLKEVRFGLGFSDIDAVVGGTSKLEKMYCPWATPPTAPKALSSCKSLTVYVPKGASQAYVEAWDLASINKRREFVRIEETDF